MPKPDPNAPAFPHLHDSCQRVNESEHWEGLTIRQEFAKAAMLGILAGDQPVCREDAYSVALAAISVADALIAALNRGGYD